MAVIILKTIFGLFIFLALPELVCKKRKIKKNTKKFAIITCKIIGIIILIDAGIDL
jgi:hypothetical protein